MTNERAAAFLLFVLALSALFFATHDSVFVAGNDAARFAQIEAIADHGEPFIDHSRYRRTVDRITLGGHDYSNKPPLLSILGAVVYAMLKLIFSWSFTDNEAQVVRALTLILVGIPSAWLLAQFYLALSAHRDMTPMLRALTTLAMAMGTIATSFSVTLNNHTVAAALLFAAFRASYLGRGVATGAFAGLAICMDLVPGFGLAPVFVVMVAQAAGRNGLLRCLAALAACAVLFCAANLYTVGSILPPKFVAGGVDHGSGAAVVWIPDSLTYPIECLFGGHGLFSVSPILVFGLFGLIAAARKPHLLRVWWCRFLAVAIAIQILAHVTLAGVYGGWSYGFRYLIPVIPLLLFFAPVVLGGWRTALFVALLPVSILFAMLGAYHPWPPAYEQARNPDPIASLVHNPVGGNAAAWLNEVAPQAGLTRWMAASFISPDERLQSRYLKYFERSRSFPVRPRR